MLHESFETHNGSSSDGGLECKFLKATDGSLLPPLKESRPLGLTGTYVKMKMDGKHQKTCAKSDTTCHRTHQKAYEVVHPLQFLRIIQSFEDS